MYVFVRIYATCVAVRLKWLPNLQAEETDEEDLQRPGGLEVFHEPTVEFPQLEDAREP